MEQDSVNRIAGTRFFEKIVLGCLSSSGAKSHFADFVTRIDVNDQMFAHSLREHGDYGAAISQFFNLSLQQFEIYSQISSTLLSGRDKIAFLDFASGYGRLTRFLSARKGDNELLYASDVQDDALDFIKRNFGNVRTVTSSYSPEKFDPKRKFDFIWVISLFSHLPERLFRDWIQKLYSLLDEHGVLCFSVRGIEHLGKEAVDQGGQFRFDSVSEDSNLDSHCYGTAYAADDFVRQVLRQTLGDDLNCVRIPRAIAAEQDLYVVASDSRTDLSVLKSIRRGVWGWVDIRRLSCNSGELYLEGWVASLDDACKCAVDITIGGVDCVPDKLGIPRPDVSEVLSDPRLEGSGWSLTRTLPADTKSVYIVVKARAANGCIALLYCGAVEAS